ncbi:Oidioi.mRNA.OKI2018_I69.PAR.g8862.t1.cds [Oikopleura dioica]|uniref:Oidioi.mRNA.OKI2018_I69.PAR.g8862.t1.cds n=1 Tax=Oikopleura dioica TaxID=34765 RepID=A0ABN7RHY9_OIKDI|nr:Oidioi.mRNA.OKI2018_I69.PAR.g8862.t1.cds [Oikopleura dioica]
MKFLLLLFLSAFISAQCPDLVLKERCEQMCNQELFDCLSNCESTAKSDCHYICMGDASRCGAACPCNNDCLNGCEGCANPVCSCKNPRENSEYNFCMKKALDEERNCISSCANEDCIEECYVIRKGAISKCPCNSYCQVGCPCEQFNCQEYAILLQESAAKMVSKSFGVIFSQEKNGKIKENRKLLLDPEVDLTSTCYQYFKGEHMLFGGAKKRRQVAKIENCEIKNTGKQLAYNFDSFNGRCMLQENEFGWEDDVVMFCFGSSSKTCFEFDGEKSNSIYISPQHEHARGGLGSFQKETFVVGGGVYGADNNFNSKLEFRGRNGWVEHADFPRQSGIADFVLASVHDSGQAFLIGGWSGSDGLNDVYELVMTKEGAGRFQYRQRLQEIVRFGSAAVLSSEIMIASTHVQVFNFKELQETRVFDVFNQKTNHPIFFKVEADFCMNACQEQCFL